MTAVLEGKATDRVPVNIIFYQGYTAHCAGRKQWEFDYGSAADQYEMQLAAIRRHPGNDGYYTWSGMNREPIPDMHVKIIDGKPRAFFKDGRKKELSDSPANSPWNRSSREMQNNWEGKRVHSTKEIERKMGPVIPCRDLLNRKSYSVLSSLLEQEGENTFLWINHSSLFSGALGFLGGPSEGWMATLTEPALVEAVLEHHMFSQIEYIKAAAKIGGHGIWNCFMNEGTNILSPDTWRRMVKPRVAQIVAKSHELGMKHIAWFLDDCRQLVGDLMDIGIDGLATEQPRVNYNCEPGDLRKIAGNNFPLFGWFRDEDLIEGNPEIIRKTLRRQYSDSGDGNPFVVGAPGLTQEVEQDVVEFIIEEAGNL